MSKDFRGTERLPWILSQQSYCVVMNLKASVTCLTHTFEQSHLKFIVWYTPWSKKQYIGIWLSALAHYWFNVVIFYWKMHLIWSRKSLSVLRMCIHGSDMSMWLFSCSINELPELLDETDTCGFCLPYYPILLQIFHKILKDIQLEAKDVLPNINRMQAATVTLRQRHNGPVCCCLTLFAASTFHFIAAGGGGDWSTQHVFWPRGPWSLTFDLDI